jgi:hypothetical protein
MGHEQSDERSKTIDILEPFVTQRTARRAGVANLVTECAENTNPSVEVIFSPAGHPYTAENSC